MLKIIVAPLLGGIIGYITNDLAIKMLFHPHREIYIGKWHVPFTPGLIPSQKERIAKSLGDTISNHLLNAETIRNEALSDANREKLRRILTEKLESEAASELTVRETIGRIADPEKFADFELRAVDAASEFLLDKLREADLGAVITAEVSDSIRARLQPLGFAHLVDGGMLDGLMGNLAGTINAKIEEKAPRLVHEKLLGLAAEGLSTRVCDATRPHADKLPGLVDRAMELYESILTNNLEDLLRAAKLEVIIENKIRSFDAAELERLVFQLMKKELNAIIYLGAILGFLMGFFNLLL